MVWWMLCSAWASGVNNPGGERIPYIKLQSSQWDVVIRKTGADRARIERVKAQCNGRWINGCAPGVDPELRKVALTSVFQEQVQLSGDFTYCSTAVVLQLPAQLASQLIRGSTDEFCRTFLDPAAVRALRSGDATKGENDLVNRLMGGQNTTSGQIRIKAPTPLGATEPSDRVVEATGQREQPRPRRRRGQDEAAPVASVTPAPAESSPSAPAPAPTPPTTSAAARTPPATSGLLGADDDSWLEPVDIPPPAQAQAADLDAELEALLAPIPDRAPRDQIVQPAPRPTPPRSSEFEALERENAALDPIGADTAASDDRAVDEDEAFGDYIVIDLDELPEG